MPRTHFKIEVLPLAPLDEKHAEVPRDAGGHEGFVAFSGEVASAGLHAVGALPTRTGRVHEFQASLMAFVAEVRAGDAFFEFGVRVTALAQSKPQCLVTGQRVGQPGLGVDARLLEINLDTFVPAAVVPVDRTAG